VLAQGDVLAQADVAFGLVILSRRLGIYFDSDVSHL
jgi:hypothetical protein